MIKNRFYEVSPLKLKAQMRTSVLTYSSSELMTVGNLVQVEIGKQKSVGVVLKEVEKPEYETKPILSVISADIALPHQIVELAEWMSSYYGTSLPRVWNSILPTGLEKTRRKKTLPEETPLTRLPSTISLTDEQTNALEDLRKHPTKTHVLQGVTGSGKTQIYIERAREVLASGRSVVILVPEIGLTSQLSEYVQRNIGVPFVIHSHLTESQRHSLWDAIYHAKEACLIIGARSALFSPLNNIGLIVVDEFHESAYHQDQQPRYHTVRAASKLAQLHGAQLILGSATPPIAERYMAEVKSVPILRLTTPFHKQNNTAVQVIDLKGARERTKPYWLSAEGRLALEESLNNGNQVMIFHNRRGTNSTSLCQNCGWVANCPVCHLPLTLHGDWFKHVCHICGFQQSALINCPECGSVDIVFKGLGTKQLVDDLKALYPDVAIARFDTDATKDETLASKYDDLVRGKIQLIVGTQMIAKGLDLPKLETIIIPQADTNLRLPDYTASERTFQLIMQAIGRVGRQENPGRAIIQTYTPDHPSISHAAQRDYENFYRTELEQRRLLNFPPFAHLMKVTATYASSQAAELRLKESIVRIKKHNPHLSILGPAPSLYERQGAKYRWQVVIRSKKRADLIEILPLIPAGWNTELDPMNLL